MARQIVEHIVLFKIKDDADPSDVKAMFNGLNGLNSLDSVCHLTAGPLRSSTLKFTHMLHARYNSKEHLAAYMVHPNHLNLVKASAPIQEDIMAVDWVVDDFSGSLNPPPGSVIRIAFFKLVEDLGNQAKTEMLRVISGANDLSGAIDQTTCGHNFSARSRGFSIGSIAVFTGVKEMEAVYSDEELVGYQKEKIEGFVESEAVFEYLIPFTQSA